MRKARTNAAHAMSRRDEATEAKNTLMLALVLADQTGGQVRHK